MTMPGPMTDGPADIMFTRKPFRYETAAESYRLEQELAAELAGYLERLDTLFNLTPPVWESKKECELYKVESHYAMPALTDVLGDELLVWDDQQCPRLPVYDYSVPTQ